MKTTQHSNLLLLVILILIPATTKGQTANHLSLEQAVNLSAKNSTLVQTAELDRRIAKSNRQQTDAIFLPQISVGYQALFTNDPLNAFGFLLQQRQVGATNFDPSKLNHPGNAQDYAASVEFQMPLLNVDKIFSRKGAKIQEEVYKHKADFTRDQVRFEVQKAYTQLQFAYKSREILLSTLADVKTIHESVQLFHQQGLIQKSDVLNAEVQVNTIETALSKAESNIANASDGLRILLGEDLTTERVPYETEPLEIVAFADGNRQFSTFRSDILAMEKTVKALKMQTRSAAMAFVPSINAFGNYMFHDDKIFRFNEDAYMVGISLKWTLFSGNMNRGKLRAASFQQEKMQKNYELFVNQSRSDVDRNRRTIVDLDFEIQKQKKSVIQAEEAFRIMSDRHKEGLVSTTDLLLVEAQLFQQQLALAQTIMNHNIACFYQDILTFTF